ncbi:HlyD family secretion protein [Erwinia typographi]|uniref:HlyD family secretion protein n=1 Tax=Erwinia typographi TaxID=371042 RepID=A0A0A3Z984_9GAMM|nr:HlyD family efflux transporter periplasmic adaptor subunit [Erwinia typographi]KGT95415.1 HlyD family secretion protein [Erwinia typographi]
MELWLKIIFFLMLLLNITACEDADSGHLSGYTHGDFIYLSHPQSEKIDQIMVKKGDLVKKNQKLVEMESFAADNSLRIAEKNLQAESALLLNMQSGERVEELNVVQSQLARARSAANLAKSQLARNLHLYKTGVISAVEWERMWDDSAQKNAQVTELISLLEAKKLPARTAQLQNQASRVDSARLERDKAQWNYQQNIIVAPEDARVYDIIYHPGERPTAGRPIITLLPPENVKVRFYIPQLKLGLFQPGMQVSVRCDGCQPVSATINYISPQAEYTPPVIYSTKRREKLLFMAEAAIAREQASFIKIGQPVRVEIAAGE